MRDDDAGFRPNAGHCDRHIRLQLVDEVDRAVIDFVDHRPYEWRLFRMVGMAANDIRRFPRNAELLVSGSIELDDLVERRHLTQQANRIELPFIQ